MFKNRGLLFSYIITFAIAFFLFQKATIHSSDDLWFKRATENTPLYQFIGQRYFTWTGRLTAELLLTAMLKLPAVYWYLLGSASFVVFASAVAHIIRHFYSEINTTCKKIAIYWLAFSIPFLIWLVSDWRCGTLLYVENVTCSATNAGIYWYTGYFNYFLPITITLLMISLFLAMQKSQQKWHYALAIIACSLYVSSSEQSAMFWALFCLFTFVEILRKREWKESKYKIVKACCKMPAFIVYFFSAIFTLFFITAPGNRVRMETETKNVMPIFSELSVMDKLQRGIGHGMAMLIERFIVVIAAIFLLSLVMQFVRRKYFDLVVSAVGSVASLWLFYRVMFLPNWYLLKMGSTTKTLEWSMLNVIFVTLLLSLLAVVIVRTLKTKSRQHFCLLLLISSLLSITFIGFSPTLVASGVRTQYLSFVLLSILLLFFLSETYFLLRVKINNRDSHLPGNVL